MTALDKGRPSVTAMVLERYMKEMAGARCEGSEMTAWREMKTADWAMPVPKPLFWVSKGKKETKIRETNLGKM
jgi:hypothetical protein